MAAAGDLGKLVVSVQADITKLKKDLSQANKKISSFSKKANQSVRKTQGVASSVGKQISSVWLSVAGSIFVAQQAFRAVGQTLNALVGPAIKFESAFAGVKKTVDATDDEFRQLSENLIDLSTKIPVAATDLAKIQEIAGQLGIRGVKNLTKFTEAVAKIAVTTNLTQEAAAIGFARIAAVIGEPIDNIEQMASAVVDLGNKFEVNEQEILSFATRISGAGKVAGLTSKDIFAIGAAFASVGIQAEAGGTAVQKILLKLQKQGKKGIGAFLDFVQDLEKAGDGASKVLDKLGFKNERVQRAFLSVAGAGGKLEKALKISNEAFREGNALNEEAEKRFATTESKITVLKNSFAALSIEIGDNFLPAISEGAGELAKFLNVMRDVEKETGLVSKSIIEMVKSISLLGIGSIKELIDGLFGLGVGLGEKFGGAAPEGISPEEAAFNEEQRQGEIASDQFRPPPGPPPDQPPEAGSSQANFELINQGIEDFKTEFTAINEEINNLAKQSAKVLTNQINTLSKGIGDAFADLVLNGKDFGKAMEAVFKQMAFSFISGVAEMIIKWVLFNAIAKALQAGQVAAAGAFAAILTSIWTIPATLASIATGGGAVAIGNAALATGLVSSKALTAGLQAVPSGRDGIITTGNFGEAGIPAVLHPNEIVAPLDKFFESLSDAKESGAISITVMGNVDDPQKMAEILAHEINTKRREA